MSEPNPSNNLKPEVKVNQKSTLTQDIQAKLQARDQFTQQHQQWETNKKIAEGLGSTIPEEPEASEEAQYGQKLFDARDKSKEKVGTIFTGGGSDKLNARFDAILKKIAENPDEQVRAMQVAGTLDGIKSNLYSQKWEQTSKALDLAPESLNFSGLLDSFRPLNYSENHTDTKSLKTEACQNVLKHLSSESSPASPQEKEEYKFYSEEGKGMKAFDALYESGTRNPTTEQIITAFDLGDKVTPDDIKAASEKLRDRFRQHMGIDSTVSVDTLSQEGFNASLENMPLLLSQIISDKPEVAGDIKGKFVGYCRSLAEKRPNLDKASSSDHDYDFKVNSYMRITHKIADSFVNLYGSDVNIYDITRNTPQDMFQREFQVMIRDFRLDADYHGVNPFKRHFEVYLKKQDDAKAAARRLEETGRQMALAQQKQEQETNLKTMSENTNIKAEFYALTHARTADISKALEQSLGKLDTLATNQPDLASATDLAKATANKFKELSQDSFLIKEIDTETDRRKKGLFGNKYTVSRQTAYELFPGRYEQLLKAAQDHVAADPSQNNFANLEALRLISERSKVKRGYSVVEG